MKIRNLPALILFGWMLFAVGCTVGKAIENEIQTPPFEGSRIEMLNVFYAFNNDLNDNSPRKIEKAIFYIENANHRDRNILFAWSRRFLLSFIDPVNKGGCWVSKQNAPLALDEPYLQIQNCQGHLNSIRMEMTGSAPLKEYKRYLDALMKEFSIPFASDNAKKQYLRFGFDP